MQSGENFPSGIRAGGERGWQVMVKVTAKYFIQPKKSISGSANKSVGNDKIIETTMGSPIFCG